MYVCMSRACQGAAMQCHAMPCSAMQFSVVSCGVLSCDGKRVDVVNEVSVCVAASNSRGGGGVSTCNVQTAPLAGPFGAVWGPKSNKIAGYGPREPKMTPRSPQKAQAEPQRAQEDPKIPQDVPEDHFRCFLSAAFCRSRVPRTPPK